MPDRCSYELKLSWTGGRPFKRKRNVKPLGISGSFAQLSDAFLWCSDDHGYQPLTYDYGTSSLDPQLHAANACPQGSFVPFEPTFAPADPDKPGCFVIDDVSDLEQNIPGGQQQAPTQLDAVEEYLISTPFNWISTLTTLTTPTIDDETDGVGDLDEADSGGLMRLAEFAQSSPEISRPPLFLPSNILASSESRLFFHHYRLQTCNVIFPLAPLSNPLKEQLLQAALTSPHLLSALLASAGSHYVRLCGTTAGWLKKTILGLTNHAVAGLRAAMETREEASRPETISTALALCTGEVISGDLRVWRTHLQGTQRLISSVVSDFEEPSSTKNTTLTFLLRWFAALDIVAGMSGLRQSTVPNGRYWHLHGAGVSDGCIDAFTGYSLELMPIMAEIGRIARARQRRSRQHACLIPCGSDDGDACLDRLGPTMDTVQRLENRLLALFDKTAAPVSTHTPYTAAMAKEMRYTHRLFVYGALLHLYRRVQQLPKSHVKPQHAVHMIIETLESVPAHSTSNILLLWPLFAAGCETDDLGQRNVVAERMKFMASFGMGNVHRALKAMQIYWQSGSTCCWDEFMEQQGWDLVLF